MVFLTRKLNSNFIKVLAPLCRGKVHARINHALGAIYLYDVTIFKVWLMEISYKVHIFWESHKFFRNLHQLFVQCTASQIIGGDFAKFCGLLRIYELYELFKISQSGSIVKRSGEAFPGKEVSKIWMKKLLTSYMDSPLVFFLLSTLLIVRFVLSRFSTQILGCQSKE